MEDQANFTTQTTTAAKPKRKRVSTYTAKILLAFHFEDDGAQEAREKRTQIEEFAKSLGAKDVEGSGHYGSTMVDAPQ